MPGMRKPRRPFSEKQQIALKNRQKKRKVIFNPLLDPGAEPLPVENQPRPGEKHLTVMLNDYLVNYDARLIEIDHKYPLGDPERPEWLVAHRKNGVKRLKQIAQNTLNSISTKH